MGFLALFNFGVKRGNKPIWEMFQRGHGNFKENEKDVKNMAILEGNIVGAKPRVLWK
jgi:hypothetical protein